MQFINKVLNSNISFKMSFLVSRLWKGKLPFDEVITKFGKQIISKCNCCLNPSTDSMNHVFIEGQVASYTWNLFGNALGILYHPHPH